MLDRDLTCNRCGNPLKITNFRCPSCRSLEFGILKSLSQTLKRKSAGWVIFLVILGVVIALIYAWNDAAS
jgi:hypothetical protein